MWVRSRQFTGRIVTVTNDKVFDEPVFNYTRGLPVHLGGNGDSHSVRGQSIRQAKDAISRGILADFEATGIPIASSTLEIVGMPPLRLKRN
jgi:hypothetical protein